MPPFSPRQITGKRKTLDELKDSKDNTNYTANSMPDLPSNDINTLCGVAAGYNLAAVSGEAV